MKSPLKLLLVAGARPNFMKIAPLIHRIRAINENTLCSEDQVAYRLVHTGQHYDAAMSEQFFRELDIPEPDINLEVGSGSHAVQTANVMIKFEKVCEGECPDWVVVVGDVNSTLACTLVAAKLGVKVAHVEAGLRSFDRTMPEEINRIVTDSLADLLLTPSVDADENLWREGVAPEKIVRVGNVMIDTLLRNVQEARSNGSQAKFQVEPESYVYVTLHRPSNVDTAASLSRIMTDLRRLADRYPVIFPVHPRTRKQLEVFDLPRDGDDRFRLIDPVGYLDSIWLSEHARMVITDSGGLQEETTYFRTPCLTLRPNTERPVTIEEGSNRLTTSGRLMDDVNGLLGRPTRIGRVPDLWDGRMSDRILAAFLERAAATSPAEPAASLA